MSDTALTPLERKAVNVARKVLRVDARLAKGRGLLQIAAHSRRAHDILTDLLARSGGPVTDDSNLEARDE